MLEVGYRGVTIEVSTGLSFGRTAELVLDAENRFLHGEAGRFRHRESEWLLHNTGAKLHLQLHNAGGHHIELPPESWVRVPVGRGEVRVVAGGTPYRLTYRLDPTGATTRIDARSTDTEPFGPPLTPAQIDYAVTLGRHRLVGLRLPPPGQAEIARLWGVTPRTVGKTFEDIRARLRRAKVEGIETTEDLLEHLVTNRLITVEHLIAAGLDDADGPYRQRDLRRRRGSSDEPESPSL